MKNPFKYGSRVTGGAFFDRIKIKNDIMSVVDGGNNVVLYGPRRYGKSSLVGEVVSALRGSGWKCIELNMMDVASLDDFIAQYARAIYREAASAIGSLRQIAGLFSRVKPKIGIDDEGKPELKFEISSRKACLDALREVLALPPKLCPAAKTLIVIDEFQEVESLGLGDQFERTMRSVIEKQEGFAYIFLGSKTHLLERMFSSPTRPFYNSAQKFLLGKPPVNESVDFLTERFKGAGISIDAQLAKTIVNLAGNVPYYLQAVGFWVFNAAMGRGAKSAISKDVDEGFSSLYSSETILLENTFTAHPQSQRILMRALAVEPTSRFDELYRDRHGLALTSTINTALKRLLLDGTVDLQDGVYVLSNPLLAYHLGRRG